MALVGQQWDTDVVKEVSDPPRSGSLSFIFPCGKALFGDLGAVNMHTCAKVCHVRPMLGA